MLNLKRCSPQFQRQPRPLSPAWSQLLSAVNQSLQFTSVEDNRIDLTTSRPESQLPTVRLRRLMKDAFFSTIYVPRDEINDLHQRVGCNQLSLIIGFVGCGKSTLMQKFHLELTDKKIENLIIDVQAELLFSDDDTGSVTQTSLTLTDIDHKTISTLYRIVNCRLISKYIQENEHRRSDWNVFRTLNNARYSRLVDAVLYNETVLPADTESWASALSRPAYEAIRIECLKAPENHLEEMACTLRFLKESVGELNIIIDNIDQLRLPAQRAIIHTFAQLSTSGNVSVTSFISMRKENLRRLQRIAKSPESDFFAAIGRIHLSTEPEDIRFKHLGRANALISEFIRRRISFLKEHQSRIFDKDLSDQLVAMRAPAMTPSGALDRILNIIIQQLADHTVRHLIAKDLYYWHNQGLRSIAVHVYNLIEMYIASHDKELAFSDALERYINNRKSIKIDRRQFRSAFYRHTILDLREDPKPKTLIWFDRLENEGSDDTVIYHLPMRILQLLQHRQGLTYKIQERGPATIGEIRSFFGEFGISRDSVDEALVKLKQPRGYDPNGLVFVDFPVKNLAVKNLPDDVSISLLPSGFYYQKRLRFMVEFLFWSVMYLDRSVFTVSATEIPEANLYDATWKTEIVCKFAAEMLAPRALEEARAWAGLKRRNPDLHKKCRDWLLLEGKHVSYIGKVRSNINSFIKWSKVHESSSIESYLERLGRDDIAIRRLID